jgi:prefoldin subunit 5
MIEKRLEELRREFQTGRELLEKLDQERTQAHETLLRISGAIQVLEELVRHHENEASG